MAMDAATKGHLRNGIVGSLAGGVVFAVLLTMMGMMGMIAMLVGSESLVVGWAVHLVVSFVFGIVFGFLLSTIAWNRLLLGMAWGVAAWIGGGLILLPIFLGMPGNVLDLSAAVAWWSLLGHLMYGLVAGGTAWALERGTEEPTAAPMGG